MRKIIVTEWMSLDGVVQSPAYADEDTSGGFRHGGWHRPFFEEKSMQWVVGNVVRASAYLLGRTTYETFSKHWPNASAEEQVLAEPINTRPKFVASRTLQAPLAWSHSTLLDGDVIEAVKKLKATDGGDILVIGSPVLARTLLAEGLVDELRLMIDPIVIGSGKKLFGAQGMPTTFRLIESVATATGSLLVTYAREGASK
ncbi:MAG TPA: dihydrofolate reductase family protein [Polyangiaceae bacterium]